MLNYSFSTVLMTILASNLLIAVIVGCFRNQKILLSVGYKLVLAFLVLTALRFLFPFELPFARNINFPYWLSAAVAFVRHVFFTLGPIKVSIWLILECVWAGGAVYYFRRFCRRKAELKRFLVRYGRSMNREEPYRTMMADICGRRRNPIWVVRAPYYGPPVQCGTIHPYIVLPAHLDISDEELYYILRHETAHYYNHDALMKDVVSIIRVIYWWNPLCKYLEKQMDVALEMRVDDSLVKGSDAEREAYCNTLNHISEELKGESNLPGFGSAISMARCGGEDLQYRYSMMREGKKRKGALLCGLSGVVAAVYVASYCFALEAYYMSAGVAAGLHNPPKEQYAVLLEDGGYDIYINGFCVEHVEDLESHTGITVVEK